MMAVSTSEHFKDRHREGYTLAASGISTEK